MMVDCLGDRIFKGIPIVSSHRDWPELSELEPLFIEISLVQIGPEVYTYRGNLQGKNSQSLGPLGPYKWLSGCGGVRELKSGTALSN